MINKFMAWLGILLCFIAGFCPVLKVPIKGNWNLYQSDSRLFFITYFLLAITAFFLFLNKRGAFRFLGIALLVWYILSLFAVWFTAGNYTSHKFVDRLLFKTIHFQWGWIVVLVGVALIIFSVGKRKTKETVADTNGDLSEPIE
ncbi:magnesium-transporting ATPase (P-type) [Pedobacter sp. UYP30]|uniref:hypothetical protein n=1 Tax=Pedobacter sp. UYP30 TaxID=1756400 RepID=UPI00339B07CD